MAGVVNDDWVFGNEKIAAQSGNLKTLRWINKSGADKVVAAQLEIHDFGRTFFVGVGEAREFVGNCTQFGFRLGWRVQGHVRGQRHTDLRHIEVTHHANHIHHITFLDARQGGHLIYINGVFALRQGCVAARVDGPDGGLLNHHAGALQGFVAVFVDFGNGFGGQRQRIV